MTTALLKVPATIYKREAYVDRWGNRHPAKTIKRKSYLKKDTGKKGRTPKKKRWYKPKHKTGWKKEMAARERRIKVLKSLKKNYLGAAREMQALANVTVDPETKTKALRDARYFFEHYDKEKK